MEEKTGKRKLHLVTGFMLSTTFNEILACRCLASKKLKEWRRPRWVGSWVNKHTVNNGCLNFHGSQTTMKDRPPANSYYCYSRRWTEGSHVCVALRISRAVFLVFFLGQDTHEEPKTAFCNCPSNDIVFTNLSSCPCAEKTTSSKQVGLGIQGRSMGKTQ